MLPFLLRLSLQSMEPKMDGMMNDDDDGGSLFVAIFLVIANCFCYQ